MYEAEGLLELLQLRQDKFEDLRPLIEARIIEALDRTKNLMPPAPAPEAETEISVEEMETDAPVGEIEKAAPLEEEMVEAPVEEVEMPVSSEAAGESPTQPVPSFCLNDKFRFRRAIFGGNKEEFDTVMNHLATLDDYEEAENFLLYDMDLDVEDPDVADFMEIIRNYYEKR